MQQQQQQQQQVFVKSKSKSTVQGKRGKSADEDAPKVDLTEVVAFLEGEVSAKTEQLTALRTDVERISALVQEQQQALQEQHQALQEQQQAHTVKEYFYVTELAKLTNELDAHKKELAELHAVVENFSQMSERISALERVTPQEVSRKSKSRSADATPKDAAPKATRKASKSKKVAPPPSYQYHGWTRADLLALLQGVLKGVPPLSVVSFVDATGPKDLTALSQMSDDPDAMAPGSVIKPKLSKLMEAVSEYYDDTSVGLKSFSNSVMRKLTDLRKAVAHSPEYAEVEIRIRKICEARKDVLRNGLPTELPNGIVTNSNSLSLLRPVEVAQVPGKAIRYVPPRQSTDVDELVFGMHSLTLEKPAASQIGTSSPRGSLSHTPKGSQATVDTDELYPEEEEDDHEEEEEEDTDEDMMNMTFKHIVSEEWSYDWTKIREYTSLFGEEVTSSKIIKIYARIENDESDKKRVLAKVACGTLRFERLADTVLNELI